MRRHFRPKRFTIAEPKMADLQHVTILQGVFVYLLTVHEGAVCAAQINHVNPVFPGNKQRVVPAYKPVVQEQVVLVVPPEHKPRLIDNHAIHEFALQRDFNGRVQHVMVMFSIVQGIPPVRDAVEVCHRCRVQDPVQTGRAGQQETQGSRVSGHPRYDGPYSLEDAGTEVLRIFQHDDSAPILGGLVPRKNSQQLLELIGG